MLQIGGIHPTTLGKADRGGAWNTILQRLRHRRPLALFTELVLTLIEVLHADHKTAWCPRHRDLPMGEASLLQVAPNPLVQLSEGLSGKISGKLLGSDLKKKRCRHATEQADGDCIGTVSLRSSH